MGYYKTSITHITGLSDKIRLLARINGILSEITRKRGIIGRSKADVTLSGPGRSLSYNIVDSGAKTRIIFLYNNLTICIILDIVY